MKKRWKTRTFHVKASSPRVPPATNWGDLNSVLRRILHMPAANCRSTADITTFVAWSL